MSQTLNSTVRLFISYSHQDKELVEKLEMHLKPLVQDNTVSIFIDKDISPGSDWVEAVEAELQNHQLHIFLLILSADSLASDNCMMERRLAEEKCTDKTSRFIPIILRDCGWQKFYNRLIALPTDGKAIVRWDHTDEAMQSVVQGIEQTIEKMREGINSEDFPSPTYLQPQPQQESQESAVPEVLHPGEVAKSSSPFSLRPKTSEFRKFGISKPVSAEQVHKEFEPLVLNVIVAEDEPEDLEYIRFRLEESFKTWHLAQEKQVIPKIIECRTLEEFTTKTGRILDAGGLVYSTLDLRLPRAEGQQPTDVSRDIVLWCLKKKHTINNSKRFEFCCISGDNELLLELFEAENIKEKLAKNETKRIAKAEEREYEVLFNDIKNLAHQHLRFCIVENRQNTKNMVWLGIRHQHPDLLTKAEMIASDKSGGLYLIFSDAAGYELDWFRLCCMLRGVKGTYLNFHSISSDDDDIWKRHLSDVPPALFIGGVDQLVEQDVDLPGFFEQVDFFDAIRKSRGSLVFIQFPLLESPLYRDKLDTKYELELLHMCLKHKKIDPTSYFGRNDFAERKKILLLPKYSAIKASEAVRKIIFFQCKLMQERFDLTEMDLDEEVVEVLAEIPWNSKHVVSAKDYGLSLLRKAIRQAYENYASARDENEGRVRTIGIDFFENTALEKVFRNRLGFQVRGLWIYRHLEKQGENNFYSNAKLSRNIAKAHLEKLERIYDLFVRVKNIVELHDELSKDHKDGWAFDEAILSQQKFATLSRVHQFLELLLVSPEQFSDRIEHFRRNSYRRAWEKHYPSLVDREHWWRIVENTNYEWPSESLPYHADVYAYMIKNGISPRIDGRYPIDRYPDLKEKLQVAEKTRKRVLQDFHLREDQRINAEHLVRDSTQPMPDLLDPQEWTSPPGFQEFESVINSVVNFNYLLMICEQRFRMTDILMSHEFHSVIPDPSTCISYLHEYIDKLLEKRSLKKSFLRQWQPDWPIVSNQTDAVRLAKELCGLFFTGQVPANEEHVFHRLKQASEENFPIRDVLELLDNLNQDKTDFWSANAQKCFDFLRRFVVSTVGDYRIGRFDKGRLYLWTHENEMEEVEYHEDAEGIPMNDFNLFYNENNQFQFAFPIPFVRVRPEYGSIWLYESGNRWKNLSHTGGDDEEASLLMADATNPWLLTQNELKDRLQLDN